MDALTWTLAALAIVGAAAFLYALMGANPRLRDQRDGDLDPLLRAHGERAATPPPEHCT